jgi:hypothetical protein
MWALVALLAAVAGLAAACGGGSAKTASASTSTTKPSSANAGGFAASRAKFTSCLEAHGVPASEATQGFGRRGGFGQGGATGAPSSTATPPPTTAAFAAAFSACRSDLPARGAGGFGNLQNSAAGRAYLQCLQLHGVTIPSTPPTTAAGRGSTPSGTGRSFASNPNFAAARQACAALAPTRSGSSSTTVAPAAS